MSPGGLLDVLDLFNVVDRVEGFARRLLHGDYRGAAQQGGAAGVAVEVGRSLVGANVWSFSVPRSTGWSGAALEQFLRHYGVVIWGRRVTGEHFHFTVKRRQANWAEYLLRRRGIPVSSGPFNRLNEVYGQQHAPGDAPPAWADREDHR